VLLDLFEFDTVVLWTYNTALNNLIWDKPSRNLETKAETADQPGKVYKTVDPMTNTHTFSKGQYLCPRNLQGLSLHSFIGHTVCWGLGMGPTNLH
jgi:hypothetical protein